MKTLFEYVSYIGKLEVCIWLTDKEWASEWKECSKKNERPYFMVCESMSNHPSITLEDILLGNINKSTFLWYFLIQKQNFTSDW